MRGEKRETGEEFGGVERVGPKVDLVKGRRKCGAVEDVVDGVALDAATRANILRLPVDNRPIGIKIPAEAGPKLGESGAPGARKRGLGAVDGRRTRV